MASNNMQISLNNRNKYSGLTKHSLLILRYVINIAMVQKLINKKKE